MAAVRSRLQAQRSSPLLRRFDVRRDLDTVMDFQYEVYESNFPGFRVDESFRKEYRRDMRRAARDPGEMLYVLEQDGCACGFIWVAMMTTLVDPRVGYIKNVYVAPHLRGQGEAERLMQAAEEWVRENGATKVMLDASVVNERAVEFYRKVGYEVERVRMVRELE